MEAPDPDLAVGEGEAHDVIDEGFCFSGAFRYAEDVSEDFFDEEEMWGGGEGGVEGEDGSGAFETIAGEVKFGHGVYWERVLAGCKKVKWRLGLGWIESVKGSVRFCRCVFTVGPLGALLIHI